MVANLKAKMLYSILYKCYWFNSSYEINICIVIYRGNEFRKDGCFSLNHLPSEGRRQTSAIWSSCFATLATVKLSQWNDRKIHVCKVNIQSMEESWASEEVIQYFGHLMRRADSLEETLMLGGIGGRSKRGRQQMRWLDASPTRWAWVWVNSESDGQSGDGQK